MGPIHTLCFCLLQTDKVKKKIKKKIKIPKHSERKWNPKSPKKFVSFPPQEGLCYMDPPGPRQRRSGFWWDVRGRTRRLLLLLERKKL